MDEQKVPRDENDTLVEEDMGDDYVVAPRAAGCFLAYSPDDDGRTGTRPARRRLAFRKSNFRVG